MRALFCLLLVHLVQTCLAQPSFTKQEYEFSTAANSAGDPNAQLETLRAWEKAVPESPWRSKRLLLFTFAHTRLQQPREAFARAVEWYEFQKTAIEALRTLCQMAVRLDGAEPRETSLVKEAAEELRRRAPEEGRAAAEAARKLAEKVDRLTVRLEDASDVSSMLRTWRGNNPAPVPTGIETTLTQAAERALAWAEARSAVQKPTPGK